MFSVYSEKVSFSNYKKSLEKYIREVSEKFEILLIDIILDYIAELMYLDVVNELKYSSAIYESPSFIRTGECIYDIVWCVRTDHDRIPKHFNHCALYQVYGLEGNKYKSLNYLYDDDLFELTHEKRKKYRNIYKTHFLIEL